MAENDIRVWKSPMGGHARIEFFRLNASESFKKGEPVSVNADGELTESGDDPQNDDILGIAAATGDTTTDRDWRTDATITTGATIPVVMADPQTYFITSNFGSTSEAFDETPAVADIGDEAGLELVSGSWGINTGATYNTCRIMDVLDANYESVQDSGGTGVHVVFVIVAHQLMPDTGVVTAPAS